MNEVVITRIFDASVEEVWKAWSDPEMLKKWWGPKDFSCPFSKIDFRVGGKYLSCMRGPDGKDYWSTGVYKEIVPMKKIVATDSFSDEKGNIVPSSFYGMEGFPLSMEINVTFEEVDGRTKMILRHSDVESISDTDKRNMEQGWNQSFDKMERSLRE